MTPYEQVVAILRRPENDWSVLEAPAPDATNLALQTMTPEEVATMLEEFLNAQAGTTLPPYGAIESNTTIVRRRLFTEGVKFWELNTAQALGSQPLDPPVDTIGEAKTVADWWGHQEILRNRLGEKLCSADEFARRNAAADNVPLDWIAKDMDPLIFQLMTREGFPAPSIASARGLTASMWLDNMRCVDRTAPLAWMPTKSTNRVPA